MIIWILFIVAVLIFLTLDLGVFNKTPHVISSKEAGTWTVPSGKIEINETIIQAAQRELCEETGITIDCVTNSIVRDALYIDNGSLQYVYYFCEILSDFNNLFPEITLSHEHIDYRWAEYHELIELPITGGQRMVTEYKRLFPEFV